MLIHSLLKKEKHHAETNRLAVGEHGPPLPPPACDRPVHQRLYLSFAAGEPRAVPAADRRCDHRPEPGAAALHPGGHAGRQAGAGGAALPDGHLSGDRLPERGL